MSDKQAFVRWVEDIKPEQYPMIPLPDAWREAGVRDGEGDAVTKETKWARALLAWEWAYVELQKAALQPHEKEALYCVHDMLRERASGAQDGAK